MYTTLRSFILNNLFSGVRNVYEEGYSIRIECLDLTSIIVKYKEGNLHIDIYRNSGNLNSLQENTFFDIEQKEEIKVFMDTVNKYIGDLLIPTPLKENLAMSFTPLEEGELYEYNEDISITLKLRASYAILNINGREININLNVYTMREVQLRINESKLTVTA